MADKRTYRVLVTGDTFAYSYDVVGQKNALHSGRNIARGGITRIEDRIVIYPAHRINLVEVLLLVEEEVAG